MSDLPFVELSESEKDILLDTWDEETTVSGTAFFPVVARIVILRLSTAEREIERLRGVCERWRLNYQSWVDANTALTERIAQARALIPTDNPELIDAGYAVSAADLIRALGGDS